MAIAVDKGFRKFLLDISEHITSKDFKCLKFLCCDIPPADLEVIETPMELLMALVKCGSISEDNTRKLDDLLALISAEKLRTEIKNYNGFRKRAFPPVDIPTVKYNKGLPCKVWNFIGREEYVTAIVNYLIGPAPRLSVIIAAPGYGKSALATEVGWKMFEDNEFSVVYVSVRELKSLECLAKEILNCFGVNHGNKPVCQAQHTLSSLKQKTLLILDNTEDLQICEDEGKKLKTFIEYLGRNARLLRMLVTTRKALGLLSSFECQDKKLVPLAEICSVKLFMTLAKEGETEAAVCVKLGAACGGIPLLLRIVASLIRNNYDPIKLLKKLTSNPNAVLRMKNPDSEEYRRDLLKFLRDHLDRDLLNALIRVSAFPRAFSAKDATVVFTDQENCRTFLARLVGHALLHVSEGTYSLHPLIQSICRKDVEVIGLEEDANNAEHLFNSHYIELLDKARQGFVDFNACKSAIDEFNTNRFNISQAVHNCLKREENQSSNKCLSACIAATDFLAKVISSDEFHKLFNHCCGYAGRINDHKRYSDCLTALGFRHIIDSAHLKLNPKALEVLEQAYDIQMCKLSSHERRYEGHAHCKSKLGLCYVMQGEDEMKMERGVALVREALELRTTLGDPVPLAAGYGELANTLRLREQYEEAINIWKEETLQRYGRVLGEHPFTASTFNWIGICYGKLCEFDQAAEFKKKALDMRKKLLGAHHQDVLRSKFELAQIQVEQGFAKEALEKLEDVASRQDKLLGSHPHTVATYYELARLHQKLGDQEQAKRMRSKAEEYSCAIKERQVEYQRLSSEPADKSSFARTLIKMRNIGRFWPLAFIIFLFSLFYLYFA